MKPVSGGARGGAGGGRKSSIHVTKAAVPILLSQFPRKEVGKLSLQLYVRPPTNLFAPRGGCASAAPETC